MLGRGTAITLLVILLGCGGLLGCSGEFGPEPGDPTPPGGGEDPEEPARVEPDPESELHTRLYAGACEEETITADGRHLIQRTFEGDELSSESVFDDDSPVVTVGIVRAPGSVERIAIQHQVAMRYRTIELRDGGGRLVQKQDLRGPTDSELQDDRCHSIETYKYPEPGKTVLELDDGCDGVDGTITTTRSGGTETVVYDEDDDGVSELVTFNFFDGEDRQIRRVDLDGDGSEEWNWSRTSEGGIETIEYYAGLVGDTLLTRTETLRGEDGTPRSQSEYRALGEVTISRSFDDFGNPLTAIRRDADGKQLAITTYRYDCFRSE